MAMLVYRRVQIPGEKTGEPMVSKVSSCSSNIGGFVSLFYQTSKAIGFVGVG